MTLRSVISEADLSMLLDIFRGYFTDPEVAEKYYFSLLDMEIDGPYLDAVYMREVADLLVEKLVLPGFVSKLYMFMTKYHKALRVKHTAPPPDLNLPFEPATNTHDFWLWLYTGPRLKSAAYQRWPKKVVDNLWDYFRSDRLRNWGYAVTCEAQGEDEQIEVTKCQKNTISSGGG